MDLIELLKEYIKPESLVVVVVLYFVGAGLKNTELVKDKFIPMILGVVGVIISAIYIIATSSINGYQEVLTVIFTAIVQGILVAGAAVYVNQLIKQSEKEE